MLPYAFQQLITVPGVKRCGGIIGAWDLFAEVRYFDEGHLAKLIMEDIQSIRAITRTTTFVTISSCRYERNAVGLTETNPGGRRATEEPSLQ